MSESARCVLRVVRQEAQNNGLPVNAACLLSLKGEE